MNLTKAALVSLVELVVVEFNVSASINKAVWSLWTKPLRHNQGIGWPTIKHHLLSWVLSVQTAQRHFSKTALVTDFHGATLLIEELGLNFDEVYLELDNLDDCNPQWWAIGKLYAYKLQKEPFIHIDSDVYLWNPLPHRLMCSPVLAQNPEKRSIDDPYYRVAEFLFAIYQAKGWMPEEMIWYARQSNQSFEVLCCGIFGGIRNDFLQYFASNAIEMMLHPDNVTAWSYLQDQLFVSLMFEQYLAAATSFYHHSREKSRFQDVMVEYLFPTEADAFKSASAIGYTHLIAGAKRNPEILVRLEQRVKKEYPEFYRRSLDISAGQFT